MEKFLLVFVKKSSYFKLSIYLYKGKNISFPFAIFISMRRMNCYVIRLSNYSCHSNREETYISNIASFSALSVFMSTNERILQLFV